MRINQTSLSIVILLLLLSCSGGQEQQKEQATSEPETLMVTARFSSFELHDQVYITFYDEQGEKWSFDRCNLPECNFGVEAGESSIENQGWESNPELIGKWFDIRYQIEEVEFPDGGMGSVLVIVSFGLNEELNGELLIVAENLEEETAKPLKLSYTVSKLESMTMGFLHKSNTSPDGTTEVISDYIGGGSYRAVVTTRYSALELNDLRSAGNELYWSEDGRFVAINGLDLYAGRGSIGLIIIEVTTGQYAEIELDSLRDGLDFEGRRSLEIQNMSWTPNNACLITLNINFEGESGHPGINDNLRNKLGSNFGKDDPKRVGYYKFDIEIGDSGSFVTRQSNSTGLVIESFSVNDNNGSKSSIPRLNDPLNPERPSLVKINKVILDRFYLSEYRTDPDGFDFINIDFTSELSEDIVFIKYSGKYRGRSISDVQDEMFFDLETGNQLIFDPIRFHTYFKSESYADFLSTYWIEGVNKAFEEAINCAGAEPYCSKFDIGSFNIESGQLTFSLTSDCFPSAAASCSPAFSATVGVSTLEPYINSLGKSALIDDDLWAMKGLRKYNYLVKNKQLIEESVWDLDTVTEGL